MAARRNRTRGVESPWADIELIDETSSIAAVAESTVRRGSVKPVLASACVLALLFAWSIRTDSSPVSEDAESPARPALGALAAFRPGGNEPTVGSPDLWPRAPEDHDPIVSGRPGPGRSILSARPAGALVAGSVRPPAKPLAVVYVNVSDRATVVDLATGDTREVELATTRSDGSFLLDNGTIVHPDAKRGLGLPSEEALVFAVRSDRSTVDAPTVLCPGVEVCSDGGWVPTSLVNGLAEVMSLDADRWPRVAELFDQETWVPEGRWLVPTEEAGLGSFRLPAPADDTTIWVVIGPVQPALSSGPGLAPGGRRVR